MAAIYRDRELVSVEHVKWWRPRESNSLSGARSTDAARRRCFSVHVGAQPSNYQRGGQTAISTRNDGAPHGADGPLPGFDMWNRNATNAQ